MAYVKQTWNNLPNKTTPLSAARLNHLETQYDEAVSDSKALANTLSSFNVLDDLTRVEVVCNFPFRSPSSQAWVQGFFYDPANERVFISRTGSSSSEVLIDEYRLDGTKISGKSFPTTATSYLESLIHWYGPSGEDMFLGEDGMSGRTTIINYTRGTVSPSFQANGRVSWAVSEGTAYRSNIQHLDSEVSTIGAVFKYDLAALKNGEALEMGSLSLEGASPLSFKGQGMASHGGFLCVYGGSATQQPTYSLWTLDGSKVGTISLDRKGFLSEVARQTPGAGISDSSSWEAEGLQGTSEGFLSGHVIGVGVAYSERFVLVKHSASSKAVRVPPSPPPGDPNTPWISLPGSNPPVWFRHSNGFTSLRVDGGVSVPAGGELVVAGNGSIPPKWAPPWNFYGVASANGGGAVVTVGVWLNGSVRIINKVSGVPVTNINGFTITFPSGRSNTT